MNKIKQILLLFVAMQILNIGLFAQDFPIIADGQNIINSATEFVAEIILEKSDSFPEHHQHRHTHNKHSHSFLLKAKQKVLFKHILSTSYTGNIETIDKNEYALHKSICIKNIVFDITPPPPKA